ncbi:class C beta-lactamase [Paracoccus sp. J56]|uniref:class C beta-lactamase n=1 Tax=Paracoccus sp. J56 TaxID=935850 RepID=UPI000A0BBFFF|nr:class C beta-lactamase [Paracoccus sp. J56]SMG20746.1 beta-lactamase class C [Paracoccus sp. J56]
MKMNYGCAGIGLIAAALAVPASAMTEAEFQQAASEIFAPVMSEYDIPGLAVGVTWQGQDYVFTAGVADRDGGVAVTDRTIFELGSISKTFNVTLAALAEVEGRLSLSDSVATHLPDLKGSAIGKVSLMDLATHQTSGLPIQVPDEASDDASLMRWLHDWQPAPGGERSYSNISIGLLGRISAQSFGATYDKALQDHVLNPLGLGSTFVDVPQAEMSRYAWGYSRQDDRAVRVNPGMLDDEAYGIKSDLRDMLRFLHLNLDGSGAPPELRKAMAQTHAGQTETQYFQQAMIWERYPWPVPLDQILAGAAPGMAMKSQPATRLPKPAPGGEVLLGKTGSTNGFGGYVALVPGEDLGLVILANRSIPNPARVEAGLALIKAVLPAGQ